MTDVFWSLDIASVGLEKKLLNVVAKNIGNCHIDVLLLADVVKEVKLQPVRSVSLTSCCCCAL